MKKAIRELEDRRLKQSHVIVELRDARIPFSSANKDLDFILKGTNKPRMIVLNKCDLAFNTENPKETKRLKRQISDMIRSSNTNCTNVFFTQATSDGSESGLDPLIKEIAQALPTKFKMTPRVVLVVGIPNCGKSSIINAIRKISFKDVLGKSTKVAGVGATPAFTREFAVFPISQIPPIYVFDSPGIMIPRFVGDRASESALRLALCGAIREEVADPEVVSDYMLYLMNKMGRFEYTNITRPHRVSDDINEVLVGVDRFLKGRQRKPKYRDASEPNVHNSARFLLRKFRNGDLGPMLLDEDFLSSDTKPLSNVKKSSLFQDDE